jgi:hypothetical protein
MSYCPTANKAPANVLPDEVHACPLAHAVGRAGDVYLCHPFLVRAAQTHCGAKPRFIAQPGVRWQGGGRRLSLTTDPAVRDASCVHGATFGVTFD